MLKTILISLFVFSFASISIAQKFTWLNTGGGTQQDRATFVEVDKEGNSVVAGNFRSSATFGSTTLTSAGFDDLFVGKYDNVGEIIWILQIGGIGNDEVRGLCVDDSGNVYVSLYWASSSATSIRAGDSVFGISTTSASNVLLFKFNPNGELPIFLNRCDGGLYVEGGALDIDGQNIIWCVSPRTNLRVYHNNDSLPNPFLPPWCSGSSCLTGFAVIRLDTAGELRAIKYYSAIATAHEVTQVLIKDTTIIVIGNHRNTLSIIDTISGFLTEINDAGSTSDGFIIFLNDSLVARDLRIFGNDSSSVELSGCDLDDSLNLYLLGSFTKTCVIANRILVSSSNLHDLFVCRIGSSQWTNHVSADGTPCESNRIRVKDSKLYSIFWTNGTADIDDQNGNHFQLQRDNGPMYMAELSSSGVLEGLIQFGKGSGQSDRASGLDYDKLNERICLAGSFSGTNAVFGDFQITSNGSSDMFVTSVNANAGNGFSRWLYLTNFIQGFYDNVNNKMTTDTVQLILRSRNYPYSVIDSSKSLLDTNGKGAFGFSNIVLGDSVYIVIKHRNSIETWSSMPIFINNSITQYDFSESASKSYGNNMIQVDTGPNKFATYSGDVNQDQTVDGTDLSLIANDAFVYTTGYVVTDITGDDFVDGNDFAIADNNASEFVSAILP